MAQKKSGMDKLAEVREKLKNTDLGKGGGGGFWSPPAGKSIIRILPEVGTMEFFYQPVGKHNLSADGKQHVYCPEFTSEGELPCPLCEMVQDLKAAGDTASKKLAGELARRRAFWMNIVVRGENGGDDSGPFVFTPGVTIMDYISGIIGDPDYGLIMDPDSGFDLTLVRTGKGLETEYEVRARRNASKLHPDPKVVKKWLGEARDLSYVEVSEDPEEDAKLSAGHAVFVLPYERIKQEYDLDSLGEDEDEEEEEVVPAKKRAAASTKPVSKPFKKPVVEEVEDDEEEEDDEELVDDDEEEEEVVPAKREVANRRMTRKSTRRR